MTLSYHRLWELLDAKNLNKTDLRRIVDLSSSTVAKLTRNKPVHTDVLLRICVALACKIEDIVSVEPEEFDFPLFNDRANTQQDKKYSVVSLFSGCGGLDLGFRGGFDFLGKHYPSNPFDIVWANEMNKAACTTYAKNVDARIVEGKIEDTFNTMPAYADVVIGGFPCQDISINGKMAGVVEGKRSGLYVWMVKAVLTLRPKIFIAENVKALLMKRHESSLQKVIQDFSDIGYDVTHHLFDAANYGVPQNRERVILVGIRKDISKKFAPPPATHTEAKVTCLQALEDLEHLEETIDFNHIWSKAKPSSGQGLRFLTATEPATTIRSECHGNIQFHYRRNRRISMREAARLQSFPDNFSFTSGIREMERMIGNAVPPVFAWHIAQSVLNVLHEQ